MTFAHAVVLTFTIVVVYLAWISLLVCLIFKTLSNAFDYDGSTYYAIFWGCLLFLYFTFSAATLLYFHGK